MEDIKVRTFRLDGDICEVTYYYDSSLNRYFGDYPDFSEQPRYTVNGRPWMTAMQDGCMHGEERSGEKNGSPDCGSCRYFLSEQSGDLIGICINEKNRRE